MNDELAPAPSGLISNPLTMSSTLEDVYANPIGHDALDKILLQLGQSDGILRRALFSPKLRNLPLSKLAKVAKVKLDPEFFPHLLELLNSEDSRFVERDEPVTEAWWKEAIFYQIYPRSFADSDGDGIGDLNGIIDQLDYLKDLGVDALWLSPIYDSPNDDNGYDIRNYRAIMTEFGTMADFDRLLREVHQRGMRLIMDLVVNHTSDEHPWFRQALANADSAYRDYYLFRPGVRELPPNNWTSFFSGPAWNFYPSYHDDDSGAWALHLFSKKQMDLNWDNPKVRAEIVDLVNWWLDKGVDGFRLDVINYISKRPGLPDGDQTIGELMGFVGVENYFYGPHLHEYLHQLNVEAFGPKRAFSVGETPGVGLEMAKLLTADYRQELDMVFNFDHLETSGQERYDDYAYDLNYLKNYLIDWTRGYPNACWMSLFYENHDNPRMVSKVNPDPQYRNVLAKLLAVIQLTMRGTPFIYQGQELGAINQDFTDIEQLRDVEAQNLYDELLKKRDPATAFARVLAGTRDHARTPMPWAAGKTGGFTTGKPWLELPSDPGLWNVADEQQDPDSVLNFYRALIALRKRHPALVYGDVQFVGEQQKDYFAYYRQLRNRPNAAADEDDTYFIECNLSAKPRKVHRPRENFELILSNYPASATEVRPYEACIYRWRP